MTTGMSVQPLFLSSGDLIADRRYDIARQYWQRGDLKAAAEIMEQALDVAPTFTSAWFSLGEVREALGEPDRAVVAFRRALASDPEDRRGAALHLMRLGALTAGAMPEAYVRTLFDQYAPRFDHALLETLNYRGPRVLRDAVVSALQEIGHPARFGRAIDLGCGTGLGGRAFAPHADEVVGCDLSAAMIAQARATRLYARLVVSEMVGMLAAEPDRSADLIYATDAVVYLGDLRPLLREAARVLARRGVLAFTVEMHGGDGVVLGPGLRFQHGLAYLREALEGSGLRTLAIAEASTRDEGGEPVPGLTVVALNDDGG